MSHPHSCSTEVSLKTQMLLTQAYTIPSVHTYAHRALISEDRLRGGGGTEGHVDLRKTSPMVIMRGFSLQGAGIGVGRGYGEQRGAEGGRCSALYKHSLPYAPLGSFVAFHLWILRLNVMH